MSAIEHLNKDTEITAIGKTRGLRRNLSAALTQRLTGAAAEAIRAYENTVRHHWHLHYWLAFKLVRSFSPLSPDMEKRPGQ